MSDNAYEKNSKGKAQEIVSIFRKKVFVFREIPSCFH